MVIVFIITSMIVMLVFGFMVGGVAMLVNVVIMTVLCEHVIYAMFTHIYICVYNNTEETLRSRACAYIYRCYSIYIYIIQKFLYI